MRRARAKVLTRKETHNVIFRASIRPSHRSGNETAALIAEDLKRWYPETYRAAALEGGLIIRDEMMRRFSKWRQRVTVNQQRDRQAPSLVRSIAERQKRARAAV
jgi:hypothetical protein